MYYVKRLLSGIAKISEDEPEEFDFTVEVLPDGNGVLMVDEKGGLFYDEVFIPFGFSEPTDHEILMTLLGVTE